VSGAGDATTKTRQLIDDGVDWIKIINAEQLTPEEMKAIVDEAHARGHKVAAHAFSDAEVRQGLIAGVDDFQHLRTQTPEYPADIVSMIRDRVKNGPPLYWTITAGANGQLNAAYLASNPELLDDPANFIGLPSAVADDVRRAIKMRTDAGGRGRGGATQSQDEINAIVKRKIAQIRDLGVEIVFGTDVGSLGRSDRSGDMDGGRSLGP
jgi:imidazolonepropionase-like amidohydrolase